ncbi:MAG: NUDIX hydrolase [Acidimicrobiales bacterium]
MSAPVEVIRDAATVMLVRDRPASGIEVFMLKRHLDSDFVGGAYVFPGGKVDDADRAEDLGPICTGRSDAEASALLGIDEGGLAYWVAAVRECFEEAGVLLARPATSVLGSRSSRPTSSESTRPDPGPGPSGTPVSFADPAVAARFVEHRGRLNGGELRLVDMCREENLVLAVEGIHYFAHWITPHGAPRRFDTRFFVAAAPPGQVALHDDYETVANMWVSPADALVMHAGGELDLILPTIKNLEAIGRFASSAELLAAAAAAEAIPTITPRIKLDGQGVRILLPGDPGYDQTMESGALPRGMPLPGRTGGPDIG